MNNKKCGASLGHYTLFKKRKIKLRIECVTLLSLLHGQ